MRPKAALYDQDFNTWCLRRDPPALHCAKMCANTAHRQQ